MEEKRYYELDWLRVFLILAVFLHHVFMPFNGDGWHIMNQQSSKLLDDIMVYFEQVRLQTLFFIAGCGSLILLRKASHSKFLLNKFHRLFIPLIIGMMLIVPPQKYFEDITNYSGLVNAYSKHLFSFSANHLWFIEFLVVFMLLAVPMKWALDAKIGQQLITKISVLATKPHGLFSLVIILLAIRISLKLLLPSQDHSIENFSVSVFFLCFFVAGMCFISNEKIWQAIEQHRRVNLKYFIASSIIFYGYYFKPDISEYVSLSVRWQLWWTVCSLVSWSALLTFVGYAKKYCNSSPQWLRSANELIYPFYILHQTVIVAFAYYIVQWQQSITIKSTSLLLLSFVTTALLCLLVIKPFWLTRYLFGLKVRR